MATTHIHAAKSHTCIFCILNLKDTCLTTISINKCSLRRRTSQQDFFLHGKSCAFMVSPHRHHQRPEKLVRTFVVFIGLFRMLVILCILYLSFCAIFSVEARIYLQSFCCVFADINSLHRCKEWKECRKVPQRYGFHLGDFTFFIHSSFY